MTITSWGEEVKEDIDGEPELLQGDDLVPHSKPNMTSMFGRFVERFSYIDITIVVALVLAASSAWFALAPAGQGLLKAAGPLDAFYFTLVTFTSLGYGDLVPVGIGRAVAVADVLFGLALVAVLIGKVASERQASLLVLLHTSDTQRRIVDFAAEMTALREHVEVEADAKDLPRLNQSLQRQVKLTRAIKNYLLFNSHQAITIQFGSFTALIGLYDEIRNSFDLFDRRLRDANSFSDAMAMRRLCASMDGLHRLVGQMARLHQAARRRDPLWRTVLQWARVVKPVGPSTAEQSARNRAITLARVMAARITEAQAWIATGHHPIQSQRVFAAWPTGPRGSWGTGVHKVIAEKLQVSNSVVSRCVDDLLAAGALPKVGGSINRSADPRSKQRPPIDPSDPG